MLRELKSSEQGVIVVEAALILLLFLICLFAVMEGGRVLSVQQTLTNAAREGARFAVKPSSGTSTLPTLTQIENFVNPFLDAAVVAGATINVQRPVVIQLGDVATQFTRVAITAPYQVLTIPLFSGLSIPLTGQALMRNETSP